MRNCTISTGIPNLRVWCKKWSNWASGVGYKIWIRLLLLLGIRLRLWLHPKTSDSATQCKLYRIRINANNACLCEGVPQKKSEITFTGCHQGNFKLHDMMGDEISSSNEITWKLPPPGNEELGCAPGLQYLVKTRPRVEIQTYLYRSGRHGRAEP